MPAQFALHSFYRFTTVQWADTVADEAAGKTTQRTIGLSMSGLCRGGAICSRARNRHFGGRETDNRGVFLPAHAPPRLGRRISRNHVLRRQPRRKCRRRKGYMESSCKHSFREWSNDTDTTRLRVCNLCGTREHQEFIVCFDCKGTGACPRCRGACSDAYGRSCDLCCGDGDCRCCNGRRGYWTGLKTPK